MSVNLITGNLFSPIQASQDSDYQAGTFGEKTQILSVGSKMGVSIVDNSTIRCEDGVLVTREGRRVQIDNGDVVEWTIPTGTQGTTSYYIVGFRLYTDDESAQLCDTFVQSVAGPGATIAEDTFRDGAVEIFVSVARVVQNGITLGSVQGLLPLATTMVRVQNEIDDINDSIRTNLLNPTAQTQTKNGVTFTNNGDGTYTVNGTASDNTWHALADQFTDLDLSRKYKMVGCPQGGSVNSYILYDDKNSTYRDTGNGVIYTPTNQPRFFIRIMAGTTCNNLLFKPMLTTDLNAKYDDYVPYSGSGALNENVAEIYENISQINSDLSDSDADITNSSNFPSNTVFARETGNVLNVRCFGVNPKQTLAITGAYAILGTLPANMRPRAGEAYLKFIQYSATTNGLLRITDDGVVAIGYSNRDLTSSDTVSINETFII